MSDVKAINFVEVVRYIRPSSEQYAHSNLFGITLVFGIRYDTKTVVAKWSICNGDNFSKEFGKNLAKASKETISFPLDLVKQEGSLTKALEKSFEVLGLGEKQYFFDGDFIGDLELYLEAKRKFSK